MKENHGLWWVYILRCRDGSLYSGITNDIGQRLEAHNQGSGAKYTRGRRPVVLIYKEPAADRSEATRRERELKSLSRQEKLLLAESFVDN